MTLATATQFGCLLDSAMLDSDMCLCFTGVSKTAMTDGGGDHETGSN